ncbi:MAG TPA: hypothetical protein DCM01_08185 [Dielma fastidiosa]|nr:hypothetical protein [Dielma fastidiosa]
MHKRWMPLFSKRFINTLCIENNDIKNICFLLLMLNLKKLTINLKFLGGTMNRKDFSHRLADIYERDYEINKELKLMIVTIIYER